MWCDAVYVRILFLCEYTTSISFLLKKSTPYALKIKSYVAEDFTYNYETQLFEEHVNNYCPGWEKHARLPAKCKAARRPLCPLRHTCNFYVLESILNITICILEHKKQIDWIDVNSINLLHEEHNFTINAKLYATHCTYSLYLQKNEV